MRAGIVVTVTRGDRRRLEAIIADRSAPQKHVWRANIILATADDCGTTEVMRRSGKSKPVVWRWQARFGAPSEAMTLQLFDDLAEPVVLHALGEEHRLQRARIVGKDIRRDCHDGIRSCATMRRERLQRADSLCRNHPGCSGAGVSRAA
jgi:hypothetical protein